MFATMYLYVNELAKNVYCEIAVRQLCLRIRLTVITVTQNILTYVVSTHSRTTFLYITLI